MNKVFLIGNLTHDPELKTSANGTSFCRFSIAVSRRFSKDANNDTDFFNIIAWRQVAETCANYLSKGKKVAIVGSIQIRSYQAQDGSNRQATEITADEVEFLSPKDGATTSNRKAEESAPVDSLQEVTTNSNLPF